jgi:hypothetical protein
LPAKEEQRQPAGDCDRLPSVYFRNALRFMLEGRGRMIAAETPFICSIPDFSS